MHAFKFLDANGCAPFTGVRWIPGQWEEADATRPCHEGIHACRPDDLAHWLADSLWIIELDGDIVESRHKVVGRRGRLLTRVDDYGTAVQELAGLCAWRARDRAVSALEASRRSGLAKKFSIAITLEELAALGTVEGVVDDSTFEERAAALAADTADFALHGDHAQAPYVAACVAAHCESGPGANQAVYDRCYLDEREFQSRWLAERLAVPQVPGI